MNPRPKGKIGRLPKALREEVNRRLDDNEKGRSIIVWLNSLPQVRYLTVAQFHGVSITENNLYQWRRHGYQTWLRRREALAAAMSAASAGHQAGGPSFRESTANLAVVHYLIAVRELVESQAEGKSAIKLLRQFCRDLVALRRGDYTSARLKLDQDCLAHREATAARIAERPGK